MPDVVNIYRMPADENVPGWMILSICLTLAVLTFLFLWIASVSTTTSVTTCDAFGPYGVQAGTDASALNACGQSNTGPCIFAKNNLADCVTEFDNLRSICNAFTFDFTTSTMKIVNPNTAIDSHAVNLFRRQTGATV